jgi:hypothetical protein
LRPISFMTPTQLNVLWVLHASHGADSAGQLHNGAVLQPLSQFPAEAEALLPPLCMLQVLREGGEEGGEEGAREARDGQVQGDPRAPVLRLELTWVLSTTAA